MAIHREELIDLALSRAADIATRRFADPRFAGLARAMTMGPPLARCGSGNFDDTGTWHDYFQYDWSLLDGPDKLAP